MKRNIKIQQKKLKRQKKKMRDIQDKVKNKWWTGVFCPMENTFIGISKVPTELKYNTKTRIQGNKVHKDHWKDDKCMWRTPEHKIDLSNCNEGDKVLCPKCGNTPVDFRMWMSATPPQFV